jgi:hypothetical protein
MVTRPMRWTRVACATYMSHPWLPLERMRYAHVLGSPQCCSPTCWSSRACRSPCRKLQPIFVITRITLVYRRRWLRSAHRKRGSGIRVGGRRGMFSGFRPASGPEGLAGNHLRNMSVGHAPALKPIRHPEKGKWILFRPTPAIRLVDLFGAKRTLAGGDTRATRKPTLRKASRVASNPIQTCQK